jgi:hypothetical protein
VKKGYIIFVASEEFGVFKTIVTVSHGEINLSTFFFENTAGALLFIKIERRNYRLNGEHSKHVGVFCTGKIYGGQDRMFLFQGDLTNYEEL